MGIENSIIARYGKKYWEEHKEEILAKANKAGKLYTKKEEHNSRVRRYMRRHPEEFSLEELEASDIESQAESNG